MEKNYVTLVTVQFISVGNVKKSEPIEILLSDVPSTVNMLKRFYGNDCKVELSNIHTVGKVNPRL